MRNIMWVDTESPLIADFSVFANLSTVWDIETFSETLKET